MLLRKCAYNSNDNGVTLYKCSNGSCVTHKSVDVSCVTNAKHNDDNGVM